MNFTEKILSIIVPKKIISVGDTTPMDFVKTRKGILRELVLSKQTGNLIGVYSRAFGDGMFLTTVQDIEGGSKEEIIAFNQYDMSGIILSRTHLALSEIKMICTFNKTYRNPLLDNENSKKNPEELSNTGILAA
jgi:hypothetical protein